MPEIREVACLNPRLHHPDGTHRSTARTADGAELDWFEGAMQRHLAALAEQAEAQAAREGEETDG